MENIAEENPSDYVIATGKQYSVKEFVNLTLNELKINITGRTGNKIKML